MLLTQVATNFQRFTIHNSHMAIGKLILIVLNNTIIGNNNIVGFKALPT